MRLLLFLSILCVLTNLLMAASPRELRKMFRKKQYQNICNEYEKNHYNFNETSMLNLVARSYFNLNQDQKVIEVCTKSINIAPTQRCARMLSKIRDKNPEQYEEMSAQTALKTGDFNTAFIKYFNILQEKPESKEARLQLGNILSSQSKGPQAMEQFWFIKGYKNANSSINKLKGRNLANISRAKKMKQRTVETNESFFYGLVFISQSPLAAWYKDLVKFYEDLSADEKQLYSENPEVSSSLDWQKLLRVRLLPE